MKDASQYPITTPFGAVKGYPLNPIPSMPGYGYHNGVDRAAPLGTPIIVNGVTIGTVDSTGLSTGNHLHIGRFVNGSSTNPGNGGFQFNSAVVYDTGQDSGNGKYVRLSADGAIWVYLHLQSILVTKGQVLKGGSMTTTEQILQSALNAERAKNAVIESALNAEREKSKIYESALNAAREKIKTLEAELATSSEYLPVSEQLYRKKTQVYHYSIKVLRKVNMEFTALTATQVALLGAVVAGATEFLNRLRANDLWVAATIFTSALLGGLIGSHYGVGFIDGVAVGLGASGAFSFVGMFKGKSVPAESKVVGPKQYALSLFSSCSSNCLLSGMYL